MRLRHAGFALVGLGLVFAASCGSDPDKHRAQAEEAGAGGEAGERSSSSGGSQSQAGTGGVALPQAGEGSAPALVTGGAGGVEVDGGAAGALSEAGATAGGADGSAAGAGGAAPTPVTGSTCGEGRYLPIEGPCLDCPALPNPYYPYMVSCPDISLWSFDPTNGDVELQFANATVYEAFSGTVSVSWTDSANVNGGGGEFEWEYIRESDTFLFHLTTLPATADIIQISYFSAQDACGFSIYAQTLEVDRDGDFASVCPLAR